MEAKQLAKFAYYLDESDPPSRRPLVQSSPMGLGKNTQLRDAVEGTLLHHWWSCCWSCWQVTDTRRKRL